MFWRLTLDYSTEEHLGFLGHDFWFSSRSKDQSVVSGSDLLTRNQLFRFMFMFIIISLLPYCTRGHPSRMRAPAAVK